MRRTRGPPSSAQGARGQSVFSERIACSYCSGSGRDRRGVDCRYCGGVGTVGPLFGPGGGRRGTRRVTPREATPRHEMPRHGGAWYADPFGSTGQQRWWDGSKWTREVRAAPPPPLRCLVYA